MITTLIEGNLSIDFPRSAVVRKYDNERHGLSHCMKAVDFVVELRDKYLFIEFKDPQDPQCNHEDREKWIETFLAGNIDEILKYKYRDSFLYEWAADRAKKPIYYYVLVAIESLTEADLLIRTDDLKRKLPVDGPPSGVWKHKIVSECAVFNISTWNQYLQNYPIRRTAP